jgi:FkbM family methyltransferase
MNIDNQLYSVFFKEYKIKNNDIIFSLGAGVGEEIEYMSEMAGQYGKVYAIEADKKNFNLLKDNIKKYKYNNVVILNIAVSNNNKHVYMVNTNTENNIANYTTLNKTKGYDLIKSITMDKLVKDFKINNIDYIKVNIEGDEKKFLEGFLNNYKIVKNWCISCHDFTGVENQKTFEFVTKFFDDKNIVYRRYDFNNANMKWADWYVYASNI